LSATPLDGIRVVELTHMVMGPTCGLTLADLGADVVKVEPPGGDNTRRLTGSGAGFFAAFNRNKRSLSVDLKTADGIGAVRALVDRADVLVENFRPGALDKLGLGPDALRAANPRLIYCSLKGFLPGPYSHRVALDEVVQMMGGLAYMTGPPGQPLRAGSSAIDIMGGLCGAIAILGALEERHRTGQGAHVQAALFESVALLMAQHMAQYAVTGVEPPPMSTRQVAWPVYDIFDTANGGQLFVGVVTDTQWRLFCEAFGLQALLNDPTLATQADRVAARSRVIPVVAAALRAHARDALIARLEQIGLPYAPIARPVELLDDPHLLASGGLLPVRLPGGGGVTTRLPALPVAFDGARPGLRRGLPGVGEHTAEILSELDSERAAE
jgi:crotonobetainyl-CoA:carnitine CoA-transferase CaiB-like acyl-CoA transferase